MSDTLEQAALSGKLFSSNQTSSPPRQRSPPRRSSPHGRGSGRGRSGSGSGSGSSGGSGNGIMDGDGDGAGRRVNTTDDELGSDLSEDDERPAAATTNMTRPTKAGGSTSDTLPNHINLPPPSSGSGIGASANTGAKGVITDARSSHASTTAARAAKIQSVREEQARKAMVGMTIHEQAVHEEEEKRRVEMSESTEREREKENERKEEERVKERWRAERKAELMAQREEAQSGQRQGGQYVGQAGQGGKSKLGMIKELGKEGFLRAVEREGWVIVLIYEPGIPRCQCITTSLLSLSLSLASSSSNQPSSDRLHPRPPPVALYRARAMALRFSLLPPIEGEVGEVGAGGGAGDEDGVYEYEYEYDEEAEGEEREERERRREPLGRPDPDVLPTLLVYKDGELEKSFVRVDWEVREDGVEGLLRREGILPRHAEYHSRGNDGDDDSLID